MCYMKQKQRLQSWLCLLGVLFLSACAAAPTPQLVAPYSAQGTPLNLAPILAGKEAVWRPDGKSFVFTHKGLWLAPADGSEPTRLTDSGHSPAWSPDGRYLAYADSGIWLLDVESGAQRYLFAEGDSPAWVDNKRLIFSQRGRLDVFYMDTPGIWQYVGEGLSAAHAPGGGSLLVERFNPQTWGFDLYNMDGEQTLPPSGGTKDVPLPPELLTFLTTKKLIPGADSPAWSPDGQYILYSSPGIWVARADGKEPQRLTVHGQEPSWSPDGRYILFSFGGRVWRLDSPYEIKPPSSIQESNEGIK